MTQSLAAWLFHLSLLHFSAHFIAFDHCASKQWTIILLIITDLSTVQKQLFNIVFAISSWTPLSNKNEKCTKNIWAVKQTAERRLMFPCGLQVRDHIPDDGSTTDMSLVRTNELLTKDSLSHPTVCLFREAQILSGLTFSLNPQWVELCNQMCTAVHWVKHTHWEQHKHMDGMDGVGKMAPVFGCAAASVHLFVYFSCCASVFSTLLSSIISLRIYDRHALLR